MSETTTPEQRPDERRPPRTRWVRRWFVLLCSTSGLALALVYLAYNTRVGVAMVDGVPAWLWNGLSAALGLRGRDGESAEDGVAIVVLVLCTFIAVGVVGISCAICKRSRSRRVR